MTPTPSPTTRQPCPNGWRLDVRGPVRPAVREVRVALRAVEGGVVSYTPLAPQPGQRLKLPSGNTVEVLRKVQGERATFDCGYVAGGNTAPRGNDNRYRVSLRADWLAVHGVAA